MLSAFLQTLTEDLQLDEVPKKEDAQRIVLPLTREMRIEIEEIDAGILLLGNIGTCPQQKREDFFILLSKANFLGQGTGGAVIGVDADENLLTLSLLLPYDMNYKMFKDALEDFANFLDYWKQELIRHNETTNLL